MKRWTVSLCLLLTLVSSRPGFAQDLEDTIEDELDSGVSVDDVEPEEEELSAEEEPDDLEEDADVAGDSFDEEESLELDDTDADLDEPEVAEESPEGEQKGDELPAETEMAQESESPTPLAEPTASAKESGGSIYSETLGTFDDNVNTEFEERLFRIFSRSSPLSNEEWASMVATHNQGLYQIQRGDTLWDISRTFFDDGNFWPKLWSENAALTNPHEIRVGRAIAFVAGTEEDAPTVRVADLQVSKASVIDVDPRSEGVSPTYPDDPEAQLTEEDVAAGTVLEEQPIVGGRPEIPEPMTKSKPVIKLPRSFVEPVPPQITKDYDNTGLDVGRRRAFDEPASVYVQSYLSDGKPISIGRVDEIIAQEQYASNLQHVLVKLDRSASIGEELSVIMLRGNVAAEGSRVFGPVVEIGGAITIAEVVDESKHVYRATVSKSVLPIELGALVSEAPLPRTDYSTKSAKADIDASVIGGEFDLERNLLGPGSLIYLDRGTGAGLQDGQILAIHSNLGARRKGTRYPSYGRPIAVIKIVRALDRVATAMILSAQGDVRVGDRTGGPFPQIEGSIGSQRRDATIKNIEVLSAEKDSGADSEDLDLESELE